MFDIYTRIQLSQAGSAGGGGGGGGSITAVNSGTNITVNTVGTVATVNLNDIVNLTHADNGSTQGQIQFAGTRFLHNYGFRNTFVGEGSGNLTLNTASADENVGVGWGAMQSLTTGTRNVAVGRSAAAGWTSASFGIAIGFQTLLSNNDIANIAIGDSAMINTISGANNVAIGRLAFRTGSGQGNVAIGEQALGNVAGGARGTNIAIGYLAGQLLTSGNSNIYIGNQGVASESSTIRIGGGSTSCYISGIASVSVSNAQMVTIDTTTGQLGSQAIPTSPSLISVTSVSTTPFVVSSEYYMSVDTSSAAITIELPNAPTTGTVYVVKDSTGNANTNNISVTTVGGAVTIDGVTTYTMNTNYQSISLVFNGTSYEVW